MDDHGQLRNPVLQTRFERITKELRCLVCQNESIADSNVDLAADLRRQVREMLVAGRSDDAIFNFMTDRYGEFVRFAPPLTAKTALIWGAPFFMLLLGGLIILPRRAPTLAHAVGRMSTFLIVAALMAAIAAAVVALPLLRDKHSRIIGAVGGLLARGRGGRSVSAVVELGLARAVRRRRRCRAPGRARHGGEARAAHARGAQRLGRLAHARDVRTWPCSAWMMP